MRCGFLWVQEGIIPCVIRTDDMLKLFDDLIQLFVKTEDFYAPVWKLELGNKEVKRME